MQTETIGVNVPDIELSKINQMLEEGQGYTVSRVCACGRHKRREFWAVLGMIE